MLEGLPEGTTYAELLEYLKRDLRLDATVDILDGTILAALTPAGVSKFPQLPSSKKTLISWGRFTTGTGTINTAGSGDWSVGGLAAGTATVTFTTRSVVPAALVAIETGGAFNGYAQVRGIGVSTFSVDTVNDLAGGPAVGNANLSFMVIG